jgi:hypothetical protein
MTNVNLNEVALTVVALEGKSDSLSIAQIKEVMKILFTNYSLPQICKIWFKYNKSK